MIATLYYGFSKRENSTKRPTTTDTSAEVDLVVKEPCDYAAPIFLIHKNNFYYQSSTATFCTYIFWNRKYYFVDNFILISNDLIEVHCMIDVLAVYKTLIASSTQYVLRSASSYDPYVVDNYYPAKQKNTLVSGTSTGVPWTYNTDLYIIGIIQFDIAAVGCIKRGGVNYFLCSSNDITNMLSMLSEATALTTAVNPMDYVAGCWYFPIDVSIESRATVSWDIAGQPVSLSYYVWTQEFYTHTFKISLPEHPLASTRGEYLNYSPFMNYKFYAGPFGTIDIPTECIGPVKWISCVFSMDMVTGSATLDLYNTQSSVITVPQFMQLQANVSVPIQMSQLSSGITVASKTQMALASASLIASNFTLNPMNVAITGASAIVTAIDMKTPRLHTLGSNGSFIDVFKDTKLVAEYYTPVDEDNDDRGRPLCKKVAISTLSGYILCADADIDLPAPIADTIKVRNYMNTGFFYE